MEFLKENAAIIVVVLVVLVLLYLFMNRQQETYQDDISFGGRGVGGRGLHLTPYVTGCQPM